MVRHLDVQAALSKTVCSRLIVTLSGQAPPCSLSAAVNADEHPSVPPTIWTLDSIRSATSSGSRTSS